MPTAFLQHIVDDGLGRRIGVGRSGRQQQPGTGGRGVGDGADQFGVIGQALAPVGFGPAPVEHEFAVGVEFQIQRRRAQQLACFVPADDVPRQPTGAFADAVMALQGAEKLVAEKRVLVGDEGVPLGGGEVSQGVEAVDAHDGRIGDGGRAGPFGGESQPLELETAGRFAGDSRYPSPDALGMGQ